MDDTQDTNRMDVLISRQVEAEKAPPRSRSRGDVGAGVVGSEDNLRCQYYWKYFEMRCWISDTKH